MFRSERKQQRRTEYSIFHETPDHIIDSAAESMESDIRELDEFFALIDQDGQTQEPVEVISRLISLPSFKAERLPQVIEEQSRALEKTKLSMVFPMPK